MDAPDSQTRIARSSAPDTILVPSGEKSTERMCFLCAPCFSLCSSKVTVARGGASARRPLGAPIAGLGMRTSAGDAYRQCGIHSTHIEARTCIPDPDGPVVSARCDLGSVR